MGEDAIQSAPRKSGCLRWVAGCLLCVGAAALLGGFVLWLVLSRWDAGYSAWEHLPRETVFAVEIHDAKTIFDAMVADRGVRGMFQAVAEELHATNPQQGQGSPDIPALLQSYGMFRYFFTAILPNSGIYGMTAFSNNPFFIVRPPRWFSWLYGDMSGRHETMRLHVGEFHFTVRDGWLVFSPGEDVLTVVLDTWDERAAPFGIGMGSTQPYMMIAGDCSDRINPKGGGAAVSGGSANVPSPGDGPFGFRDPFAAPASAVPVREKTEYHMRLAVTAEKKGWLARIELLPVDAVDAAAPLVADIDAVFGSDIPVAEQSGLSDVEAGIRFSEQTFETVKQRVGASVAHRLRMLWLDHAGKDFSLLASRPVAETGGVYPPLPVVSVGWTLAEDAPDAAEAFSTGLDRWIDDVKAEYGHVPGDAVAKSLRHQVVPDGNAGLIEMPAVLVNGARPAWRIVGSMGWMATDPAGLPDMTGQGGLDFQPLPTQPAEGCTALVKWNMTPEFLDSVSNLLEDRLATLPDSFFSGTPRKTVASWFNRARAVAAAYSGGVARARVDLEQNRMQAKAFVPYGTK